MPDDSEVPMTAAEELLIWLLITTIGVPDNVSYAPDQGQKIIADRLTQATPPLNIWRVNMQRPLF
uniref:Uncharacterized protein n=1 Tax=Agrobacterium albertimagni TaxID=147266 RepID=A0A7C1NTR5_9HYPH